MSTLEPPTLSGSSSHYEDLPPATLTEDQQLVLDLAWLKIEDGFDSIPGGPHLLELSKRDFGVEKSALLFPYALMRINYGQPPLDFDLDSFPYQTDHVILAQALVLEIIKHLIRSYVEDPLPSGSGNFSYLSRRDYIDRWSQIYERELLEFQEAVKFFRRKYLNLGRSKVIVDSKAGRLFPVPLRTRYARGYWYR